MGTINEKVDSRTTQEKREFHDDSGRNRNAEDESRSSRNKQKRISRADSPRPDFIGDGNPISGKLLRQLIDEYTNQVANKKAEIVQLESRIQEFNALLEQLEANKQT